MDPSGFCADPPGSLEEIAVQTGADWGTDWAFVPAPMPVDFRFPDALWPLLLKAREELARLDGVGRHLPNQDILIRPLQHHEYCLSLN